MKKTITQVKFKNLVTLLATALISSTAFSQVITIDNVDTEFTTVLTPTNNNPGLSGFASSVAVGSNHTNISSSSFGGNAGFGSYGQWAPAIATTANYQIEINLIRHTNNVNTADFQIIDISGGSETIVYTEAINVKPTDVPQTTDPTVNGSGFTTITNPTAGSNGLFEFPAGSSRVLRLVYTSNDGGNTNIRVDAVRLTSESTLSTLDFTKSDVSSIVSSSNPVSSSIEINASGKYSIVNIGGQTVQSGAFDGEINVETLANGVYFYLFFKLL